MRSRKLYAVALLGLVLAACNELLGNDPGTPVDSLCAWLGDGCNCYRRFAAGTVASTLGTYEGNIYSNEQSPRCGVFLDGAHNAIDPTTGTIFEDAQKQTFGVFLDRDHLDTCILTGSYQGGQIVFDPPLNVTSFPPSGFSFQMINRFGDPCGVGSFDGKTSFSIGFSAPEGSSGGGGSPDGSSDGDSVNKCQPADPRSVQATDPAKEPITYGTFSMTSGDPGEAVTAVCPNGEIHKFSLSHLDRCDGEGREESFKALLPTAEVEASPGDAGVAGYVRFRVFWPPTATGIDLHNEIPIAVEYFHCMIPPAQCFDESLSEGETDIDCGGACILGCDHGKSCLLGTDCVSKVCEANGAGILKCAPPQCGDRQQNGSETCDDGNVMDGDGCSATCEQEPGYACAGSGPGSCWDINECFEDTDDCPVGVECVNIPGSVTCACDPGFAWDGEMCVAGCGDGDLAGHEGCDDGNVTSGDGCTVNCTREFGYFCMGEGPGSCVDIDECAAMADTCLDIENCVNTSGSFQCECTKPETAVCGGVCIDITTDEFNCGGCGQTCLPNQDCVSSICCPAPADTICGGVCTDTQSDENSCGDCGTACGAGGMCLMGTCCELPNIVCGPQCVNTQTNSSHCGGCDNACAGGMMCVSGKCCAAPANAVCGGACTDTLTDEANCGGCGMVCAGFQACLNGTCQ